MHEASLAQGLLAIVANEVEKYGAGHPEKIKITALHCEAGLLACFEPETLTACFEIFAEGSVCQGAELKITTAPLDCVCATCGHKFRLFSRHFVCPQCGGPEIGFKGGSGLTLTKIEAENTGDD